MGYNKGDWYKAPNLISYVRLAFSWVPAALIIANPNDATAWWWAAVIFALVAATDILDGQVARRFNMVTDLGTFLDPLIDKILVLLTIVPLTILQPWLWPFTILFLARELVIYVQIRRESGLVPAIWSGKVKMVTQVVAITAVLVPLEGGWIVFEWVMVATAMFWTIFSWIHYYHKFVKAKKAVDSA